MIQNILKEYQMMGFVEFPVENHSAQRASLAISVWLFPALESVKLLQYMLFRGAARVPWPYPLCHFQPDSIQTLLLPMHLIIKSSQHVASSHTTAWFQNNAYKNIIFLLGWSTCFRLPASAWLLAAKHLLWLDFKLSGNNSAFKYPKSIISFLDMFCTLDLHADLLFPLQGPKWLWLISLVLHCSQITTTNINSEPLWCKTFHQIWNQNIRLIRSLNVASRSLVKLTYFCASSAPDSLGGPFPSTSHRCHHKPKRCLPIQCGTIGGPLPISPLLFHPNAKGSQIIMDLAQKTVKRQASFCNAITFCNRPIALYEQVRLKVFSERSTSAFTIWKPLHCQTRVWVFIRAYCIKCGVTQWLLYENDAKHVVEGESLGWITALCHIWFSSPQITKKQCCWSGALRLGFTSKDPSRINPDNLPKYACPDLVSQSGFWAKALPEEFANEGNIIAFWVDKKGRVFYRINESSPMLFFSGVRTAEPLWALIDVYGLTRGVQLLGKIRTGASSAEVSYQTG